MPTAITCCANRGLASGSAQSCELRMRHQPDGQPVWIKLQAIAATGDNGAAVIRIVLSDITSRKRLEEDLIGSEADTKAILDGASDAVFIADASGRYQYVNAMATQLLGFTLTKLDSGNAAVTMGTLLQMQRGLVSEFQRGLIAEKYTLHIQTLHLIMLA